MRAELNSDRWFAAAIGALMVAAGILVGAHLGAAPGAAAGGMAAAAGAVGVRRLLGGRSARRRALLAEPFPPHWREFLLDNYDHYERLPPDLRRRFENDVRIFMAETRITGIGLLQLRHAVDGGQQGALDSAVDRIAGRCSQVIGGQLAVLSVIHQACGKAGALVG